MVDLRKAVDHFLAAEPAPAIEIMESHFDQLLTQKLAEMKKRIQAERYTQFDEAVIEHPGKHNAPVADITHGDDHIGHIEHSQTARGSHHYRVVSYVEAKPDNEHHKTFGAAKSEGHKLVNKHAWASAIHAEEVNEEDLDESKDPEDRKKEKDRDAARAQDRKGKEQARAPLDEEYGTRHGEYRVSRPDKTGHAVYHAPEGRKEVHIGATETLAKAKSHDQQVMAHHDHGPTYHATHERAVQHIISAHKTGGHGDVNEEALDESHGGNTTKSGRTKMVKVRVRGGKVQRRKKMSAVKGFKVTKGGKVARMSATERRNRKMGARKGKIKRRAHRGATNRKLHQSLRKRKTMGL